MTCTPSDIVAFLKQATNLYVDCDGFFKLTDILSISSNCRIVHFEQGPSDVGLYYSEDAKCFVGIISCYSIFTAFAKIELDTIRFDITERFRMDGSVREITVVTFERKNADIVLQNALQEYLKSPSIADGPKMMVQCLLQSLQKNDDVDTSTDKSEKTK